MGKQELSPTQCAKLQPRGTVLFLQFLLSKMQQNCKMRQDCGDHVQQLSKTHHSDQVQQSPKITAKTQRKHIAAD